MCEAEQPTYFKAVWEESRKLWDLLEGNPKLRGPWIQLFRQIQDPRNVLSELLQNADDANATKATVEIKDEVFVFKHNGDDFTEEDFRSLCGFGHSNKRTLHTIGFRGIGFKSAFSIGDVVSLVSPTLSVHFRKERFSEPIPFCESKREHEVTISVKVKTAEIMKAVKASLSDWNKSPISLLFFNSIRELSVCGRKSKWEMLETASPCSNSTWLKSDSGKKVLLIESGLNKFPRRAFEETQEERAILEGEKLDVPQCSVKIVLFDGIEKENYVSGKLYSVLPTRTKIDLPFACNSSFVLTPDRRMVKNVESSPTNKWLLNRLGKLAAEALLEWIGNDELDHKQRCGAYSLLRHSPEVDEEDENVAFIAEFNSGFDSVIAGESYLLADTGNIVVDGIAVPRAVLDAWDTNIIRRYFGGSHKNVASRNIGRRQKDKLVNHGVLTEVQKSDVWSVLQNNCLPVPDTWDKLLSLWTYCEHESSYRFPGHIIGSEDLRIFPEVSRDTLVSGQKLARIGADIKCSPEDREFLAELFSLVNTGWLEYLEKKTMPEETKRTVDRILRRHDLTESGSSEERMIQKAVAALKESREKTNWIRLAQIAASWEANIPSDFVFVMRNTSFSSGGFSIDIGEDIDDFAPTNWCASHVLHSDYRNFISCSDEEWRHWVSKLDVSHEFIPFCLKETPLGRQDVIGVIRNRVSESNVSLGYEVFRNDQYILQDFDFFPEFWTHWEECAKSDSKFWGRLFERLVGFGAQISQELEARALQYTRNGRIVEIRTRMFPAKWLIKFREVSCVPDSSGCYRFPSELYRRAPSLINHVNPVDFIGERFDTPKLEKLLDMLGVRSEPPDLDIEIDRLHSLSEKEVLTNEDYRIASEIYRRIDSRYSDCASERDKWVANFHANKIVLTATGRWVTSAEAVHLPVDPDIIVESAVAPQSFGLELWSSVGVVDLSSEESAVEWIRNVQCDNSIGDKLGIVKSLLRAHPASVCTGTECWLNCAQELTLISNLRFHVTHESVGILAAFDSMKREIADLSFLKPGAKLPASLSRLSNLEVEVEQLRNKVASCETNAQRLVESIGKDELFSGLPVVLKEYVDSADSTEVAEYAIRSYHEGVLRHYSNTPRFQRLCPPGKFLGKEKDIDFVSRLNFPESWAGARHSRFPPCIEVSGAFVLPGLHDYQREIVDGVVDLLCNSNSSDKRRGLISLPTGSGKTRVAIQGVVESVCKTGHPRNILWVADRTELCEQAAEAWRQVWSSIGPDAVLQITSGKLHTIESIVL